MRQYRLGDALKIYTPAAILTVIGFVIAYQFVEPAPPRHVVMATGGTGGAYFAFANRYREQLAAEGITLEVRPSNGSVENIDLLTSGEADIAFVQGGIGDPAKHTALVSLGSLYYEPLWIFYRSDELITRLTGLASMRVALGRPGSGTRSLAKQLFTDNEMAEGDVAFGPLGGEEAAESLLAGETDAVFMVTSPRSETVRRLVAAPGIKLMNLERGDAYIRRHRHLALVDLPRGVMNLAKDIPQEDTRLLAATANLVAAKHLHPALIDLFLQAADREHGNGGLFEGPDAFPSPKHLDFPLSEEARRFHKSGPPFLLRYLPFWAATLVDRLKVLLLPLLTLLIPLVKILPPFYRWRVRSRIYRWYRLLQEVELDLARGDGDRNRNLYERLDAIDHEVENVHVPLSYADQLYALRLHIRYVRDRIAKTEAAFELADPGARRN